MKIYIVIGDSDVNSVDRQLAEMLQSMFENVASAEILDDWLMPADKLRQADALWFIINGADGCCPQSVLGLLDRFNEIFAGKRCTLSSIGGRDGGVQALRQLYDKLISLKLKVMDDAVTCVPLNTSHFECSDEFAEDLFWQKYEFLNYCIAKDVNDDRGNALLTVCGNYLKLMKSVSVNGRAPTFVKIDYPDVVMQSERYNFPDISDDLKELHYEIDALTADYGFSDEEIEVRLLELIAENW